LIGQIVSTMPCDHMQQQSKQFGNGHLFRHNEARMWPLFRHPLTGELQKVVPITRYEDSPLSRRIKKLCVVRFAEHARITRREPVDPAFEEDRCQLRV